MALHLAGRKCEKVTVRCLFTQVRMKDAVSARVVRTALGCTRRSLLPLFHCRFDGLQLSARFAPFALRGELAIALQMLAHLLQTRVPGGRRSPRRWLHARRGG